MKKYENPRKEIQEKNKKINNRIFHPATNLMNFDDEITMIMEELGVTHWTADLYVYEVLGLYAMVVAWVLGGEVFTNLRPYEIERFQTFLREKEY